MLWTYEDLFRLRVNFNFIIVVRCAVHCGGNKVLLTCLANPEPRPSGVVVEARHAVSVGGFLWQVQFQWRLLHGE